MTDELAIVVRARDFATPILDKMKASLSNVKAQIDQFARGTFEAFRQSWLAVTAAVYGFVRAAQGAWNLAEMAAGFAEQKQSLDSLAASYGTTADQIISTIGRVSNGLIGQTASVQVAGESLVKGLKPEQLYELARAAETLSNITGEKAAAAFGRLSEAVALGRERAAENLVGVISLEERYPELASKMTDTEKVAARYRIVMERVNAIQGVVGDSTDSVADKMERFQNQIEDIKRGLGDVVIRMAAGLIATFQSVAAVALTLTRVLMAVAMPLTFITDTLRITHGKLDTVVSDFLALGDAAQYTAEQANDNFTLMFNGINKVGEAAKNTKAFLDKLFRDEADKYVKSIADAQEKINQMYAQFGVARARTEGEFTRQKVKEFESANKVVFADLPAAYRQHFLEVVKADWEKTALTQAKIQEEMFSEMARRAEATATAVALAQATAATAAATEAVQHQMTLDEMRFKANEILESEAVKRRAENEKKLLEIKRNALIDQSVATDDEAERTRLGAEYGRLAEQIKRVEEYRAFNVNVALTKEYREQLETARKIRQEIDSMNLYGSEKEVADLQSAYEDDLASFKEKVYQKKATWEEYDAYVRAREQKLQRDLTAINGNFSEGMLEAVREYVDGAGRHFNQGKEFFVNTLRGMEDALTNWVTTGKLNVKSFANSVIADLARIAVKQAVIAPILGGLSSMFGGLSSMFGGPAAAATSGVSLSGGGYGFTGLSNAGGSWLGDPAAQIAGARAAGGDVLAGKTYIVGERGPELFRVGSSGTIVPNHALGGNTSIVNHVNVPVTVVESGGGAPAGLASGRTGVNSDTAAAMASIIRSKVTEVILEQTRPGGLLQRA